MNEWDSFLSGLMGALSWKDGQDNALIGGEPSWTYLLGLGIHFFVIIGFWGLILFEFYKNKVQAGSWKGAFRNSWNYNLSTNGHVKSILGLVFGLPIIFIAIPFYAGYRITNGIWRYHYFTNQITELKTALVTGVDTETGGSKSTYSRITFTITVDGKERKVNVSDSNKSLARSAKKHLKTPIAIEVYVNQEGQIVYLK